MEIALGVLGTLLVALLLFNTVLLIGIAGSLAKMIRSTRGEDNTESQQWARILKSRKVLQARQGNDASYADTAAMQVAPEPPRNWDGVPKPGARNWDGIPRTEE